FPHVASCQDRFFHDQGCAPRSLGHLHAPHFEVAWLSSHMNDARACDGFRIMAPHERPVSPWIANGYAMPWRQPHIFLFAHAWWTREPNADLARMRSLRMDRKPKCLWEFRRNEVAPCI